MINVLVTAVGGDIGQGVLKALRLAPFRLNIVGTDISASAGGIYLADKGYLVAPAGENPNKFIRQITQICCKEKINIIFSCHENEQHVLAQNKQSLERTTGAEIIVQTLDVLEKTLDKCACYKYLEKCGIRVPETYTNLSAAKKLVSKYGFPFVIKPRRSSGSRNFHVVNNYGELKKYWRKVPQPLIQEFIANRKQEEYTVGLFLDSQSRVLGKMAMLRTMRFGLTNFGIVDRYPDVEDTAVRAAECLRAVGPCNVQLRRDRSGLPCVIEVNARISSTVAFRAKLGFNEPQASIEYFVKHQRPSFRIKKAVIMKLWDELIIPADRYRNFIKRKVMNRK